MNSQFLSPLALSIFDKIHDCLGVLHFGALGSLTLIIYREFIRVQPAKAVMV